VTVDPSRLQAILDRLANQNPLGDEDREILAKAVRLGQSTLASGDRAVAIGGNADNVVIVTGDRNVVIPKELAEFLQGQVGKGGEIHQQIGDRTTYIFNLGNEAKILQETQRQEINPLLQQLPSESLQRPYRNALPADAYLFGAQTTNPEEMVANLQDFPQRLLMFIQQIVADESLPRVPREKLSEVIGLPKISQPIVKTSGSLQSHLLITVRRKQDTEGFVVNGWLIPDDAVQGAERFHPLDIDPIQKGKECNLSQMPHVVDELVQLSLDYLWGKQFELTIEMFLPLDYLHEGIDIWKIVDLDDEIPIGTKYRVLVRTYDRLTPKYLRERLSNWYKNWDRVKGLLDVTPDPDHDFEHLQGYGAINWKRLENNLTQKVGLKLTCGLLEEHREGVIKAVHRSATPIAIWSRCSLQHLDQVSEINLLISSSCLAGLSEAVLQKRQAADWEDEPEMHLGKHLAILWENPYRLPPDVAQLIPGYSEGASRL
jgi:vWA-MoxR associated protein C-terminal domain